MVETRGRPPKNIKSTLEHYRKNPAKWIYDTFGIEVWDKQEEIMNTVWNNRYTAVKSCFASGKSFVAACLAIAFVHLYKDSTVITTAPSYRQLSNIWDNVHWLRERAKADLGSTFLKHEIRCAPGHKAIGFTTNNPVRLQGIHADRVLIIVDESAGMDPEIHERLDALMTGEKAHRLDIGNPLSPEGHFYDMFQDPKYEKMTISAFDTPNVQAGEEVIPGLVTQQWIEEQRHKHDVDSPKWKSEVLGEFPDSSEEGLIPLTWLQVSQNKWEEAMPEEDYKVFGFDPAGGGLDSNVIIGRTGTYVHEPKEWTSSSLPNTVAKVQDEVFNNEPVYVDNIGVGYGVVERLMEANFNTIGVNVQSSPENDVEDRFLNLRAELYWTLRESLNPKNTEQLLLPPSEQLIAELSNIKYETTSKGKLKIESKKDMKKRGLESPNHADALMLTMMDVYADAAPITAMDTEILEQAQISGNPMQYQSWDKDMMTFGR